jgi:hypothetical protein
VLERRAADAADELVPWLASLVDGLTWTLHDAEAERYTEAFKVVALAEGIATGADSTARELLGAVDKHAAASSARPKARPPAESELVTLTPDGTDDLTMALGDQHGVWTRLDEFGAAYRRLRRAHERAWRRSQRAQEATWPRESSPG